MKLSFVFQLIISVIIGFVSSLMYGALVSGSIGSIGLTIIMISVFLVGKLFGEFYHRLDNTNPPNTDKKDIK
jgi:hypothetical protein